MPESKDDIAKELFRAAEARASQHGLRFGQMAGSDVEALSRQAADRILLAASNKSEHKSGYIRGAVRVGSEAMAALVDEMTSARFRIPGYAAANPEQIGEETLHSAKSVLCPLWPICD